MIATPAYQSLVGVVERFGRARKRWRMLHGLALFMLLGPGSLLVWFLLDWAFKLPAFPLLITFVVAALLTLYGLVFYLVRPVLDRLELEREAVLIEKLHGTLDNGLIGSLQLGREAAQAERSTKVLGYSTNLVAVLLQRTADAINPAALLALIDRSRTRKYLSAAAAVAVVILALVIFARSAVAERIERLQDAYAAVLDALFPVEMKVTPGDLAVVRGRPVTLGVEVIGSRRKAVELSYTNLKTKKASVERLALADHRSGKTFGAAEESFTYQFKYGGRKSKEFKVLVGDLPVVNAINYEMTFPSYTGQPTRTLSGRIPRLQGLVGTGVLVSFAATTELHPDMCYVQWQDGSKQPITTAGRFGHFAFTVGRADRATVYLTGAYGKGFEMAQPISFEVGVQQDEAPVVNISLHNKKLTMLAEEVAAFAVPYEAEDDFGVAEVNLEYKIDTVDELLNRSPRQSSIPRRIDPAQDRVKGTFAEVFKTMNPPLQPGDRVTITVTARDNNTETGPSLGRSQPVEIVVVRPDLSTYTEVEYGFGGEGLLKGLTRVARATDLLVDPTKTVRTEVAQKVDKQPLKSRVNQESFPSGSEDAVGGYFQLLSGAKQ